MILSHDELVWVCNFMFPPFYHSPDRCKKCRHYRTAIKVGDEDFIEGEFCTHFDNEVFWDEQKVKILKDNAKNCKDYGIREKGLIYIGEVRAFVQEAHWV